MTMFRRINRIKFILIVIAQVFLAQQAFGQKQVYISQKSTHKSALGKTSYSKTPFTIIYEPSKQLTIKLENGEVKDLWTLTFKNKQRKGNQTIYEYKGSGIMDAEITVTVFNETVEMLGTRRDAYFLIEMTEEVMGKKVEFYDEYTAVKKEIGTTAKPKKSSPPGSGKAKISKNTFTYENGDVYSGEWRAGKRHGHGKQTYNNGAVYEGEWRNGKRHGKGKYISRRGEIYYGDWQNGLKHGTGILTLNNGRVLEAVYEEDKLVSKTVVKEADDFEGIGISLTPNPPYTISIVGKNTPAEKAGLKADDIIDAVDGVSLKGKSSQEVVDLIKGPSGTTTRLKIIRDNQTLEIPVKRGKIDAEELLREDFNEE